MKSCTILIKHKEEYAFKIGKVLMSWELDISSKYHLVKHACQAEMLTWVNIHKNVGYFEKYRNKKVKDNSTFSSWHLAFILCYYLSY